jgi:uncharacterized protein
MGKLLSWIAIAFAIYVAYKVVVALQRKARLRQESQTDRTAKGSTGEADQNAGQKNAKASSSADHGVPRLTTLIACAHCGLQLPSDEALNVKEVLFCSEAHARLGVKRSEEV